MAALNDPLRARLLRLIEQHELSVGEIAQVLQLPQSTASRHIKVLADHAWLSSRRHGTSNLYRLADDIFPDSQKHLWSILRDSLSRDTKIAQDDARLQRVLFERQNKGQEFFASSAGRWDKLRNELFGSEFELRLLPALLPTGSVVVDLGCGTGRITELLAPFAARVIGVDGSEAMIEAARQRVRANGANNVDFHHAQLQELPLEDDAADVALMILVLHYVSNPQAALREAARVLKPGGKLVLVDMQPHDHEEYRSDMGHLWQGFAQEQLINWLSNAGFPASGYTPLPPDPSARGPALFVSSAHTETQEDPSKRYLLLGGK